MALNLRQRFGPKGTLPQSWLMGDFRFVPAEYASLREYKIEHDEVDMVEKPLAVDRLYFLIRASESLDLELALCLEGTAAAAELLFRRLEAFQREPAAEAVQDVAVARSLGQVGVAWSWGEDERDGVAGFVRHNVLAILQGSYETLLEQAQELDAALARLNAGDSPPQIDKPSFDLGAGEAALRVEPGGRVDLGLPMGPERLFFLAAGGSVNRDPREPTRHYFRAGLGKGPQVVTVLGVGAGLLPARQTIRIAIE